MLDLESQKQLAGYSDESCLAEIADSLGVDALVVGSPARRQGPTGARARSLMKPASRRRRRCISGVTRLGEDVIATDACSGLTVRLRHALVP